MEDKLKYYTQKCFEYAVTHTFWYLLTTGLSFLVLNVPKFFSGLAKDNKPLSNVSNILSIISLAVLLISITILVVSLIVFKKADKKKLVETKDGSTEIDEEQESESTKEFSEENFLQNNIENNLISQIHFKKVTISMKIESCACIEYTMKYDGYATKSDIETFEKQLLWSGTKYIGTTLVSKNIEAHIDDNIGERDHSPYTFKISFDEDIALNDKIKFTTKTMLSDITKCMMPISSFYVKYPIDELVLIVSAPIGLLHTMRKKCYKDAGREIQLFTSKNIEQQDIEGYRIYSYTIPSPTSWLHYALEWKFSEKY